MKRWGKDGGTPAASPKKRRNRTLLQTYLVSLVSLCLSVTMLLGTTMAWFTSNVEVPENEIYVGTLDVDLLWEGESLKVNTLAGGEQRKVFDKDITWYPDHVEVRSLTVIDQGEIPFTYRLTLTPGVDEDGVPKDGPEVWDIGLTEEERLELLSDFRRQFNVYVKEGPCEETISAQDLADVTEWTLVGNLQQIYEDELSVFAGESEKMIETEVEGEKLCGATYSIAIHMNPEYDPAPAVTGEEGPSLNDFQGNMLNFTIKLVANQLGAPELVKDTEQMALLLKDGASVTLADSAEGYTLEQNLMLNNGVLDGKGQSLYVPVDTGYDCGITTTGGTVRNLKIFGTYNSSRAIGSGSSGDTVLTRNLYIDNVTIDSVQYAINGSGDGKSKVVVTNSEIYGWLSFANITSFDFVGCTIGEGDSYDGYMAVYGNTSFTKCVFDKFDLCGRDNMAEDTTITFTDCLYGDGTSNRVKVTAANFKDLFMLADDEEDFYKLKNCTILVDGEKVDTTNWGN